MNLPRLIKENHIGILGLILLCIGLLVSELWPKNIINVIGIVLLMIYAKQQKNDFFYYAELVVLLGTLLNVAQINTTILMIVMIIASILVLFKIFSFPYYRTHVLDSIIGLIGLFGLAFGFSTGNNWGFIIGGFFIALYGFIGFFKGVGSALIFAILNLIFAGIAIYALFSITV